MELADNRRGHVKDSVDKVYFKDKEKACDLWNGLVVEQGPLLTPDMLREVNVEQNAVLIDADGNIKPDNGLRDIVYFVDAGKDSFYYCIEVQSSQDRTMPVRVMNYDAHKYKLEIEDKDFNDKQAFYPVVSVVLNLSKGPWAAPCGIRGMFNGLSDELRRLIPEYSYILIDPYVLEEEKYSRLYTDLKYVLNYIAASGNPDKMRLLYQKSKGAFLSAKAVMLLNERLNVNFKMPVGEEEIEMCVAMEQLKAEWTAEGRAEGRMEGRMEGRAEGRAEMRVEMQERIALQALRMKMNCNDIQKLTSLSMEEITSLARINGVSV